MKKFFTHNDIFKDHSSYFHGKEKEYEQILKRNLSKILNEDSSIVLNFNLKLYSSYGGFVCSDLLLIKKDYSGYVVIEIEIENHSIRTHVLPQIRKLVSCNYFNQSSKIFDHLRRVNNNRLNRKKFMKMLHDHEPNFCVVSNRYSVEWDNVLGKEGFEFVAVTPYLNDEDNFAFYVKFGSKKDSSEEFDIQCNKHCFMLEDKTRSKLKINTTYEIKVDNDVFSFYVNNDGDKYFLYPYGTRRIQDFYDHGQIESMKILRYSDKYIEIKL